MRWSLIALIFLLRGLPVGIGQEQRVTGPAFDYQEARAHEIKPHRRTIPVDGVRAGFNQLTIKLTVSATGDVIHAEASGDDKTMTFWPQLEGEVAQWKFRPFEQNGKAVTAKVEEYLDLVPPERLPKVHVVGPVVRADSKVTITLQRSGCYGSCPSYTVDFTTEGIVFDGGGYVVAMGRHTGRSDADAVRALAKRFVAADFYSMEASYYASVTDMPGYGLKIMIDGRSKEVSDYVGQWEGMPAVIAELEDEVDEAARTSRWITGSEGLVQALRAEPYNFQTFEAQMILKGAESRGEVATVRELLQAGVPLKPFVAPKVKEAYMRPLFEKVGWLAAGSGHWDVEKVLIAAGASQDDPVDKNLALAGAARSGNVEAVRGLIAYGADPHVDLSKMTVTESTGGMTMQGKGAGSVLIDAAGSGNPEVVREILRYKPKLEARDREGKTAIFAAGEYRNETEESGRVECVRLLVEAGANVNARDDDGNTPLHETFLTGVEEELLKLGANVNARNKDGETPIFTTVDDDAIALFTAHGADLSIRNKKGQTVVEAAKDKGPTRKEALRMAIQAAKAK